MNREQDILFLDAALIAAGDNGSPDFETLLDVFDLPPAYKDTLIQVLKEGSWRASESPIETVWRATMNAVPRRATMRAALRRDEEGRNRRREVGGYSKETLGWLNEIAETSGVFRGECGQLRRGGGRAEAREEIRPQPIKHVPRELRATSADSREVPDWTKIAARAGLDEWETRALHAMARGETCYGAMQALVDSADKRAMEAAWRRLKRNLDKVRTILVSA
jgi:hypothetical protein